MEADESAAPVTRIGSAAIEFSLHARFRPRFSPFGRLPPAEPAAIWHAGKG
jgi:hypothetical protein